jgi:hypoxanthine phosphoribosyltransferase
MIDYKKVLSEILFTEDQIAKRVAELGAEISRDYAGLEKFILVCILRGGVVFMVDLAKHITIPHAMDFMAISSYGVGTRESNGMVRINMDLTTDIRGWHVLVVEDIIDSGFTLKSVLDMLSTRNPASLHVCALLDKSERREVDVPLRYRGFKIPNKFVFGYGLDLDEYYRNLPFIGVVDLKKYQSPS